MRVQYYFTQSNTSQWKYITCTFGEASIVHEAFVLRVYLDSPFVPRLEMVGNLHHTEQVNLSPGWSSTILLHNPVLFYTIQYYSTTQSSTILHNPVLFYTIQYYSTQYSTILRNPVLFYTIQYYCIHTQSDTIRIVTLAYFQNRKTKVHKRYSLINSWTSSLRCCKSCRKYLNVGFFQVV